MPEYNFFIEHDKSMVGMTGASPVTTIPFTSTWRGCVRSSIVVTGLAPVMFLIVIPDVIGTAYV